MQILDAVKAHTPWTIRNFTRRIKREIHWAPDARVPARKMSRAIHGENAWGRHESGGHHCRTGSYAGPAHVYAEMPRAYEVVRDRERFLAIRSAWQELWQRSGAGVFQSHAWIAACLDNGSLNINLAWDRDRLLAALPLVIRYRSGLRILEWVGQQFSDYCDGIVEKKHDALLRVLWERVYRSGGFDLVWLKQVADSARFYPLTQVGPSKEFCLQVVNRVWPTGDAWFRSLNKKSRNDHLRGKRILAQRGKLAVREVSGDQIEPLLNWAIRIKWDWLLKHRLYSPLLHPNSTTSLFELVHALASLGALRIFLLECSDQPVAISINVIQGDVMLAFFATYDPEYERGSPGIVLMTEYTIWAFDRGIKVIDYLRGEEPYKFKFANESVHLRSLIKARTLRGLLGLTVYRLKNRREASKGPTLGAAYRTPSGLLRRTVVDNVSREPANFAA